MRHIPARALDPVYDPDLFTRRFAMTLRRAVRSLASTFLIAVLIAASGAAQWSLGTYTPTSDTDPSCPTGYTCHAFVVSGCTDVTASARGFIAARAQIGAPRGLVMFFTGGEGTGWWTQQSGSDTNNFAENLRALGFAIVQVRWVDSWLLSSPGNDAGTAHLGCRPATVIQYVHDTYYVPLGVTHGVGEAGFCITGNSGGSSQVGYALAYYGLDSILDVVIPSGGPPHAAMAKSMTNFPNETAYHYPLSTRQFIDEGFGYFDGNGPGAQQDPSFIPRWLEESHSTGANDYVHPTTRIHFLFGAQDQEQQAVGGDYVAALASAGTPMLTSEVVPNTPHPVYSTPEGRAAILAAILPPTPPAGAFCFGDGTIANCPCHNEGGAGRGCGNSHGTGGALLAASGNASLTADTLQLSVSGEAGSVLSIFLQGDAQVAPVSFGDGLRCTGGHLKRLRTENAVNGNATYPDGAETHVSVQSANLGDAIAPGETRYYQTYYRDASTTFCASPVGNTWNVSNGRVVVWGS
jgi:hypothetical protein